MSFLLAALVILLLYLTFLVNVFGFGLIIYDNVADAEFADLSRSRKNHLNHIFSNVQNFRYFVQIFSSCALIIMTILAYQTISQLKFTGPGLRVFVTMASLLLLWLIFMTVVQFYSKRVSTRKIIRTLSHRLWLIRPLYLIFSPIVFLLTKTLTIYKREVFPEEKKEDLVERAIESMAASAGIEEPLMEDDEIEMIGNIFELDKTAVKAVMVPRIEIVSISAQATIAEVKEIVKKSGHSRFPVYGEDADDILGILYVKDLFYREIKPGDQFNVMNHIRKPFIIPESKRLDELLEELKKSRMHIALVVDEYGGTAGLVTMEDILEVIVGDIQDEHDFEHPEIVRLADGSVRVDANVSMEDLAEFLEIEPTDDRFETVGGLIYDLAGTLPEPGRVLSHDGLEFTVEKVKGQRIETVRIRKNLPKDENQEKE